MKTLSLRRLAFFFLLILVFFLVFGGNRIFKTASSCTRNQYDYLSLFSEVIALVKTDYVEEIKPSEKFPGAFTGMLYSTDKLSAYLNSNYTDRYRLYQQNKTFNCGIYGIKYGNYFYVTAAAKNSPAETHGIKPGWVIKGINGKNIFGLSYWEMALSLSSEKNIPIELILFEKGSSTPTHITLPSSLPTQSITLQKIEENTLYIELFRINTESTATLKQILEKETPGSDPLKLILDLRKTDMGDLDSFVQLTPLLLHSPIQLTVHTKTNREKISLTPFTGKGFNTNAAIIINRSTILYNELLAAALKIDRENQKSSNPSITFIGAKTRGLISRLNQIPLRDGTSILLSDALFELDGKKTAAAGITPDIKLTEDEFSTVIDRCLALLKKNP